MAQSSLTVALISDVFFKEDGVDRLHARLRDAKEWGAELAVLPEIPLNRWAPATKESRDDDAEEPGGRRHQLQAEAARDVGIGLVGGAIVKGDDGVRRNTALIFDAEGNFVGSYSKLHVPHEPGFWEKSHYEPGTELPRPFDAFGMPIGVQICSDINRPEGSHLLAAMGCEVILGPRSTELATYERWRAVFRGNALTCAAYVLSVNRPLPEKDVLIGGASVAVAPNGDILLETSKPVGVVTLHHNEVVRARKAYPGYLDIRADLYARLWGQALDEGLYREIAKGEWGA